MSEKHVAFSDWLSEYRKIKNSPVVTMPRDMIISSPVQTNSQDIIVLKDSIVYSLNEEKNQEDENTTAKSEPWYPNGPEPSIDVISNEEHDWKSVESELWASLNWESIQVGFPSDVEVVIRKAIQDSSDYETFEWIYKLYLNNSDNALLACSLIHALSHLDYEVVYPFGPMMALAMLAHKNKRVVQYAIKAFSNWNSKHSLKYIESFQPPYGWAAKLMKQVVDYIREYGDDYDGFSNEKVQPMSMDTRTA